MDKIIGTMPESLLGIAIWGVVAGGTLSIILFSPFALLGMASWFQIGGAVLGTMIACSFIVPINLALRRLFRK